MARIAATIASATLAAITTAATAQTPGIQNHPVQDLFADQPCSAVIREIDDAEPDPISLGKMVMAFGYLMGFEAANPHIRGTSETILKRLRADCATQPNRTALDLLNSYRVK